MSLLSSCLRILLLRLARLSGPPSSPAGPGTGRSAELADRFRALTARPGGRARSVAEYARELGVPPGHLHTAIKRSTGLSPGRLIRDRRILEAERLIAATGLTITQVSVSVGFADPAYFCRGTGLSPGEFRRTVSPRPDGGA
ncbi:helix-turn-helix domain-containing protein [Streptomyces sp. NPDC004031]